VVRLKRAYEAAASADGYRVLVDRLWPRGRRKRDLALDAWLKELAPSDPLRRWFAHDPERWAAFRGRYRRELRHGGPSAERLRAQVARARRGTVTLVFSSRDVTHNNAVVLKEELDRLARPRQ
jgi:uncharacterized protein YeaO (DUF488 family)